MYRKILPSETQLQINQSELDGETIEMKMERIINNGEPISDGAPLIYTERKDGVLPEYNVRTDKMEIAAEAMDKVAAARIAKRDQIGGDQNANSGQSIDGTESTN